MGAVQGKVAVISGALGGLGRAACRRFCEEGATVVGIDAVDDQDGAFAKELRDDGCAIEMRRVDVTSSTEIARLAEHVHRRYGRLDVLYNNAGVNRAGALAECTDDDWDFVMDVNLKSVFLMTRAFAALLREARGAVINISSIGAQVVFDEVGVYCTSKAGVTMLTKAWAAELGPDVRVNAICPGHIDTPMPRGFAEASGDADAVWSWMADGTVLGRVGQPNEVAELALWLASDASSYATGAAIALDGGWSLR